MPPIVVNDGDYYHFVTTEVKLATTAQEAEAQSFDLDGDGEVDKGLTGFLPQILPLVAADVDVNQEIADAITVDGSIILLHSVRANSLETDSSVSWQVFLGDELAAGFPADQFTGNGAFNIAANSPMTAKLNGRLGPTSGGRLFQGGPGTVTLNISIEGLPSALSVSLVSTRIKSTVTATGGTGIIGGAITTKSLREQIFPFAVEVLQDYIADPANADNVQTILNFIDTDMDGTVDVTDLETNSFVQTVLGSFQIDLINDPDGDGIGPVEPGEDGVNDSIPLSVGFSFVPAKFTASGETGTVIPAP